ncbi:MAG TPA: endolytic transglycosylase MltG [Candidatus Paceibacterota bacterium]|nr:endolytic transglycosylase MltG [Candidatus Paceibacterota bacterium]
MENLSTQNNQPVNFNIPSDKGSLPKKAFFYIVVLFFFFLIIYFGFLSAPKKFPVGGVFSINTGDTLRDVSKNLKEQNLIRSRTVFETFVILYGGEKHILIGDYLFKEKVPVFEVARRVAMKERNLAPLKITIPEGFTNLEIAETFSSKLKNFDEVKFLEAAKDKQGFLFPDTYFSFSEDNEQDVLAYMQENFDKKIQTVQKEILASGKSQTEILIMASIIEKEAKGDSDRAVISGILWNRISKHMPLQVDADMWTYKNKGLPASPICNPGIEAIKAAIKPANSPYLYYLHDTEGEIHYAKTFEEHKLNKAKYLK